MLFKSKKLIVFGAIILQVIYSHNPPLQRYQLIVMVLKVP